MNETAIAWTHTTWNPVSGCSHVSPGCDHCYAEAHVHRFAGSVAYPNGFDVTLKPHKLGEPARLKAPAVVFVNSMSDLFHADVPLDYIARVFAVMAANTEHEFQVLTKRSKRMRSVMAGPDIVPAVERHLDRDLVRWPLPNVWLGVSVESGNYDFRTRDLAATPATVRFVSVEPMLAPALTHADASDGMDWVIIGGESGQHARPMPARAALTLIERCQDGNVPVFFKQTGTCLANEWRMTGKGENLAELPDAWAGFNVRQWPAAKAARVAAIRAEQIAHEARTGRSIVGKRLPVRSETPA